MGDHVRNSESFPTYQMHDTNKIMFERLNIHTDLAGLYQKVNTNLERTEE